MRLTPTIRAVIILAFLAWLIAAVVPLLEPPEHVRHTDAATTGTPAEALNPRPAPGNPSPPSVLSESQVLEILRRQGYYNIGAVERQQDGSWTAEAAHGPGGAKAKLSIAPDGRVAPR
jgi:hypothetical protein